jgi:site-specific DNA recombinase
METSIYNTGNTSLLQQFAVKSERKNIVYGDRAITYNRCSTERQDSVEWQAKITGGFVRQNGWPLVKSFGAKESAKTDDRKVFNEMREFCTKENIRHIVFYSYDRFSRAGNLNLIDELRDEGIKVHSATQLVDDETASGRMMQKLFLVLAEADNFQRREKIIEGLKNKLRKGECIGEPPIGYEKLYVTGKKEHDHDKRQCFVNDKGKILRQAFYWKDSQNLTDIQIVERLKTMGIILTPKHLRRIFRNIFYCGYITHRLLDEGEIIRGKHEALVDEAMFFRINGVLNQNPHGWKKINRDADLPLKVTVSCGQCGLPLTGYVKKIYAYYKCRNKGCNVNLNSKKLHLLFKDKLAQFAIMSDLIPLVKTQLEKTYLMLHTSEKVREKPMKDELARLNNELHSMEFNHSTGNVSKEIFEKHSALHLERIYEIERELEILKRDSSNLNNYIDKVLQFVENLPKLWENLDYIGKVRLQKLLFPQGLRYLPEKHEVRTQTVNPIFSAIASISTTLNAKKSPGKHDFDPKDQSVYPVFQSSNFFWENLEEIALKAEAIHSLLRQVQKTVISTTGDTMTEWYSTSTEISNTPIWNRMQGRGLARPISGSTSQVCH